VFSFIIPSSVIESIGLLALVTACLLMGSAARKHKSIMTWGFPLAIIGVIITVVVAPFLPVVKYLPYELAHQIQELAATFGATDPLSVIFLMMILGTFLTLRAKLWGERAGSESANNDWFSVLVTMWAIDNMLGGLIGFLIALALVWLAYMLAKRQRNEFIQTLVIWLVSTFGMLLNYFLHDTGIEVATLSIAILGGFLTGSLHPLPENSFLNWVERGVFIVVLIMCINNTINISQIDPNNASLGDEFMVQIRATRVLYALAGLAGIFIAFAGMPAIFVIGLTATKAYEAGLISKAAFLAGGSLASIQTPLLVSVIIILLINWYTSRKSSDHTHD
jgi:hypothetical protein